MKLIGTQLAAMFRGAGSHRNLRLLGKLLLFLLGMILVWSVLFHVIMAQVEGQEHSWFTGVYWSLTVMTTLGFGDITFHTDLGRMFSTLVLLSGVFYLLIVMPFAFIHFFYAPWLEAQDRLRLPRKVAAGTSGHVILGRHDEIAAEFIAELAKLGVPYALLESDPRRATELQAEGYSVVTGPFDSGETHAALRAGQARMLVANLDDAANSNLVLTFREEAAQVPVVALVDEWDSVDVLELSGADQAIPLKHRLGQLLASRVPAGRVASVVVGRFHQLLLAELTIHETPLSGLHIRDTRIRERFGLNIFGIWERGHFVPARPDTLLSDRSVIGLVGTRDQLAALDASLQSPGSHPGATVVLGGGKVGWAACHALRQRGVRVHLVERDAAVAARLEDVADEVHIGDAADRAVLMAAGLARAPAVLLSTNDDAVNIYLAIYCRRLNPQLRIVSRITHERNIESIFRAGADFVLSSTVLAVQSLTAALLGRELIMLGVGVELFQSDVPPALVGKSLTDSRIGERTGLNVIALRSPPDEVTEAQPGLILQEGGCLIMIGTAEQFGAFLKHYT